MPSYTRPTQFTTGQLLGRANLSILRDNDDYFWGLAHGWQPIPGNLCDTDADDKIFDGWHYYKTDATNLDYYVTMDAGGDPGSRVRFYYDYDDKHHQHIVRDPNTATTVTSDTLGYFDIDAEDTADGYPDRPEGLYRVVCEASGGVTGYCRPPFTVFTGTDPDNPESYGTPPIVLDGDTSSTGIYNRVRLNDIYFNACQPTNIAFSGMRRSGSSVNCWDGWTYHRGSRIYYRITLPSNWDDGVDSFSLQYDYGGANQQELLNWTTAGTRESYVDLDTTSYTYTPGTRYRVTARIDSGRLPDVQYIFVEPQTTDVGPGVQSARWRYIVMDEFTVGEIVRGRIVWPFDPWPTEVSLLSDNDRVIFSALCTSAKVGRRDYAVRSPSVALNSTTYSGDLRIVHRYDTLVYRTTDGEMTWDTETQSLDDYGDDGYQTLDLRGLDLMYGQVYKITGADYAAEIP